MDRTLSGERSEPCCWLHFDKSSGELCLTQFTPQKTKSEIEDQILYLQEVLANDMPPYDLCYPPKPEGKAGNEAIHSLCGMCSHKHTCYPSLRSFQYSNKVVHLCKVVKVPDVPEITVTDNSTIDYGDFS